MEPGNLPAVRVWTAKTGVFGSRPVEKPELLIYGGPNPNLCWSTHGICRVWLDPAVPISGSAFRVLHLWSHSDILLLIVNYWDWYITVHFGSIGRLNDRNKSTCAPYHIPKYSVNGGLMIVDRVSWVIWGCDRSNSVINRVFTAFIAKKASETLPTPSWKWASMERQGFWVLHLR